MDSGDDLLGTHNMESGEEEDGFYSSGTDDYYNESDGDETDYGFVEEDDVDDSVVTASRRSQRPLVSDDEQLIQGQTSEGERVNGDDGWLCFDAFSGSFLRYHLPRRCRLLRGTLCWLRFFTSPKCSKEQSGRESLSEQHSCSLQLSQPSSLS
ncbi:hypothetical protein HA466_0092430 [Hirschfeldia incana]|nr:hypothetical protein HA466_0185780 [Hirschfeldia incana]KAJ0245091.1 hypothetical protein HA466_0185780 [Hirschfeldia incana]KAJ0256260.1 hypothetical protein HA466_0092430 [Hirschfeldia incana]